MTETSYRVTARNYSSKSDNRMHADDVAQRYGFAGALVPGVAVFGHMTHPLTDALGADWLGSAAVATRFLKPAYHGDELTVRSRREDGNVEVTCENAAGVLLATLSCTPTPDASEPADEARSAGPEPAPPRIPITFDAIELEQPFTPIVWRPDTEENDRYRSQISDAHTVYADGVVHPHAILSRANFTLTRRFIMPAWIHAGSEIRFRECLRVGDTVTIHAVPMAKWERKGHQFIRLYIAYLRDGRVATEIQHTAIFRIAEQ